MNDPSTWPRGIREVAFYHDGRKLKFRPDVLLHDNGLDCIVEWRGGAYGRGWEFSVRSNIGLSHALMLAEEELRKQAEELL